jgi:hypothetical protein
MFPLSVPDEGYSSKLYLKYRQSAGTTSRFNHQLNYYIENSLLLLKFYFLFNIPTIVWPIYSGLIGIPLMSLDIHC